MTLPSGELAALAAAFIWSCTSMFFTRAGRIASPTAANAFKVVAASLVHLIAMTAMTGHPIAAGLDSGDAWRLVMSGAIGIALGDSLLFNSWHWIGTRRAMLVAAVSPVIGAVGGVALFDDHLGLREISGIALALAGMSWVIAERRDAPGRPAMFTHAHPVAVGVGLAVGAAIAHAAGALLVKDVLQRVDVLPATQVRVAGAAGTMLLAGLLTGNLRGWIKSFRDPRLAAGMTIASFFGPFCGILLYSYALANTSAGVALTLAATIPIWLLPLGAWFQNDRPTLREAIGALIAILGVALLLWNRP